MKKIILIAAVLVLCLAGRREAAGKSIDIDDSFPDYYFAMYIRYAFDTNEDDKLSDAERKAVKEIDIGEDSEYKLELEYDGAISIKGIEKFPNLEKLDCSGNELKKLDISKLKNLKELRCQNNYLKKLDLSKNKKLEYVRCNKNKFSQIDISKNTNLVSFFCGENKITTLDISKNVKLKELGINKTKIKKIDLRKLKNLRELYCHGAILKKLDLSKNKKLTLLDCGNCKNITTLELKHLTKLTELYCGYSSLRKLDLRKNKWINALECHGSSLISGSIHFPFSQLENDCQYSDQKRTIKVKKIGKSYYVPIKGFNKTNVVTKLSAGKITDKGIKLKGKKIPKKITYYYNMFTDGNKKTKVTIYVKK